MKSSRKFLPFLKRFHAPILAGVKTMTLRSRAYGDEGDIVDSPVGPLRIIGVHQETPLYIRDHFFREEGCESPGDFQQVWEGIHNDWDNTKERLYFLHRFEVVR